MKNLLKCLVLLVVGCVFVGCGYSARSSLPSNLRTINIPPFKNSINYNEDSSRQIYIPLLEVEVRNNIIDRYQHDGNLRIADGDNADLVLKGELVNFDRSELREEDDRDVEEYRVHISVNLQLWDTDKNEMKWEEKGFTGEATYFVTGPKATSEQSAINEAMVDLARRIVERTIEDW